MQATAALHTKRTRPNYLMYWLQYRNSPELRSTGSGHVNSPSVHQYSMGSIVYNIYIRAHGQLSPRPGLMCLPYPDRTLYAPTVPLSFHLPPRRCFIIIILTFSRLKSFVYQILFSEGPTVVATSSSSESSDESESESLSSSSEEDSE